MKKEEFTIRNLEIGKARFQNWQLEKLPFVLINMAMTADGKIATANRAISSFGSAHDREHLLELRATADAVMTGARTADLNPVNLGRAGKVSKAASQARTD